jgi:hypothetical protein
MHPNENKIAKNFLLNLSMFSEYKDKMIKLINKIAILLRTRDAVLVKVH